MRLDTHGEGTEAAPAELAWQSPAGVGCEGWGWRAPAQCARLAVGLGSATCLPRFGDKVTGIGNSQKWRILPEPAPCPRSALCTGTPRYPETSRLGAGVQVATLTLSTNSTARSWPPQPLLHVELTTLLLAPKVRARASAVAAGSVHGSSGPAGAGQGTCLAGQPLGGHKAQPTTLRGSPVSEGAHHTCSD